MLKDGTVYLRLGFVQKFTDLDAMYMKIRTELQSSTDLPECRQRQLKKIQVSVIRVESTPILTDVKTGIH